MRINFIVVSLKKFKTIIMEPTSMEYRLIKAGIEIIRPENNNKNVFLKYNGKTIIRPNIMDCPYIVKKQFGIEI